MNLSLAVLLKRHISALAASYLSTTQTSMHSTDRAERHRTCMAFHTRSDSLGSGRIADRKCEWKVCELPRKVPLS